MVEPLTTPSTEALVLDPSETCIVPVIDNSQHNWLYPDLLPYFDADMYAQNHQIMQVTRQIYGLLNAGADRSVSTAMYPVTTIHPDKAITFLQHVAFAHPVYRTLAEITQNTAADPIHHTEATSYIQNALERIRGNTCLASPTHLTDLFVMQALEEHGIQLSDVGLLVIDQHIDAQLDENLQGEPAKSNFLLHLLKKGIGSISVVGVNSDNIKRIVTGNMITNKDGTQTGYEAAIEFRRNGMDEDAPLIAGAITTSQLHEIYKKYYPRLVLADGYFAADHRAVNNPHKLTKTIQEQVALMQKNGVKHLLVSFDMDSLHLIKEEITATPYNPLTAILALGLQDLQLSVAKFGWNTDKLKERGKLLVNIKRDVNAMMEKKKKKGLSPAETQLLQSKNDQWNGLFGQTYAVLDHIISSTVQFNSPMPFMNLYRGAPLLFSDEGGFSLGDATRIIRAAHDACTTFGMQFGIPVGHGRLTGTVSELEGLDYKGNTARAFATIARELNAKASYEADFIDNTIL